MNTSRIRDLAKQQGKSVTYICKLINRPKYYLNDVDKKPDRMISNEDLKTLAINLGTTAEYLKGETDSEYPEYRRTRETRWEYGGTILQA